MPDGGRLTIRSSVVRMDVARRPSELSAEQLPEGRYAEVVVADTGVGIDRGLLSKIFEPYFTTKTPGRGTGLGLATVYGAIAQCGGAIHVDSAPGQGAAFTLWLPLEGQ
jgi:signal transduction histidine kinase